MIALTKRYLLWKVVWHPTWHWKTMNLNPICLKRAVNYCHFRGTTVVSVFLLDVTQCVHLCYPIVQRLPLSLSNDNTLLLFLVYELAIVNEKCWLPHFGFFLWIKQTPIPKMSETRFISILSTPIRLLWLWLLCFNLTLILPWPCICTLYIA